MNRGLEAGGYTLEELARVLEVEYRGDPGVRLLRLATLQNAGEGDLSFLGNPRYAFRLPACRASAVIVDAGHAESAPNACLIADDPYLTYARASHLFEVFRDDDETSAVHATAVISPRARLANDVQIGAYTVVGPDSVLESGVRVGSNCSIGAGVKLGAGSQLRAGVHLYHGVTIGQRVIVHSGAVIGADGFGFARSSEGAVKIAQLGGVRVGDDVEIGAGTTIDRGALDDTVIGPGVKIDNQVQIAHNCVIGEGTIICGCSALAGSTELGRYCVIGGAVGIIGHLKIADHVTVSAMSFVSRSVEKAGVYSSGTLLQESREWKKNTLRLQNLDSLSRRVRELEQRLEQFDRNRNDSGS